MSNQSPRARQDQGSKRPRRGLIALAVAAGAALVGAGLVLMPEGEEVELVDAHTGSADINPEAYYVLENAHSGLVADVEGGSTDDGADLIQWQRTDADWQQFRFEPADDGHHTIINRHSGLALEVWERSTEPGAEVRQYTSNGEAHQQWLMEDADDGSVTLTNRHSGLALEVWEWGEEGGDRLSQFESHGGANQQWRLLEVGADSGGGDNGTASDCGEGTYDAEVTEDGGTYTAARGTEVVYEGASLPDAARAALDSLDPGRTTQESVVVRASGDVPSGEGIELPAHTLFEVCGTLHASGGDAVTIAHVQDVSVPYLSVTGTPGRGVWVRTSQNVHLGEIDLRQSGGAGIRIDSRDDDSVREATDITVDHVYVEGTEGHGVETYGVDGITIGTVIARDTGYSGLLLNDTVNADVGLVDGEGAGTGTGYAAFRMANRNGQVEGGYPDANVHVEQVIARGGGRGVFCVSESGGFVIDEVDLAGTGNNAVLIENCYNGAILGGTVEGGGEIRLAARSEFANNRDITISGLTVVDSAITENPCGENTDLANNEMVNSSLNIC
jgi:hypothetical protein